MFKNAFNHNLIDDNLRNLTALPGAASTTVYGASIDLKGHTNTGYVVNFELGLNLPALSSTILPNGSTMTGSIQVSDDPTFNTGVVTLGSVVATGANAAGAVSVEVRARVPAQCPRYARPALASGAGTTSAAAVSAEFAAIF